jgi:hypothetical protein
MQFGLFGAGAVKASFVARVPRLADRLGPVSAAHYRLASRMVNALRAGYAVPAPEGLQACSLLLLQVPADHLAEAVALLASADLEWKLRTVLACDSGDSGALEPLRGRGASVGSLASIPGCPGYYLVEGDVRSTRAAEKLVRLLAARAIHIDRTHLPFFEAGVALSTSLFTPLIAATEEALKAAGMQRPLAGRIAGELFQNGLRAWQRQGRASWSGPLAAGDAAALGRQLHALERAHPQLAGYYLHCAVVILEYLGKHAELHAQLENRRRPGH